MFTQPYFKQLNAIQTVEFMQLNPDVTILDLRDLAFFDLEHFPNAKHISLDFINLFIETVADKSQSFLVHCGAGVRAPIASKILTENCFENMVCCMEGYRQIKASMGLSIISN
jgi:rhodanese-related sulfurtransferase